MVTATAVREGKGNNIAKEKYMKENLTELVAVRLFKDNDKYNSDVFVSVNCNNYLIRRGETVMVPLFIKKELDRAELQRKRAEYYRDEGWKSLKRLTHCDRTRLPQRTRESGFMSLKAGYMRICMLRTSMRESGLPIRKRSRAMTQRSFS